MQTPGQSCPCSPILGEALVEMSLVFSFAVPSPGEIVTVCISAHSVHTEAVSGQVATSCLCHLANIELHFIPTYVQTQPSPPRTDVPTHTHVWLLVNATSTVKTGLGEFGKHPAEKQLSLNFLILNYIKLAMIIRGVSAETSPVQGSDTSVYIWEQNGFHCGHGTHAQPSLLLLAGVLTVASP